MKIGKQQMNILETLAKRGATYPSVLAGLTAVWVDVHKMHGSGYARTRDAEDRIAKMTAAGLIALTESGKLDLTEKARGLLTDRMLSGILCHDACK
jgi:hypothetical protein